MSIKIDGLLIEPKDLNQRYANTYILISIMGGEPFLVKFMEATGKEVKVNTDDDRIGSVAHDAVSIHQDFPALGAVNYDGEVHYLERKPARQWSRGFRRDVIADFNLGTRVTYSGQISFQMAKAAYFRHWINKVDGLKLMKEGKIKSFAMNPMYWIAKEKKRICLFRRTLPVAEIVGSTPMFFQETVLLKPEVSFDLKGNHANR
jgi:hypothetical protein